MPSEYFIAFESNNNSKKYEKDSIIKSIQRSLMDGNRSLTSKKEYPTLESLKNYIDSLDIFLPFRELRKGRYFLKEKEFYLPGYGFIEYDTRLNYLCLEENLHVNQVVFNDDTEELELISGIVIESERSKMEEFFQGEFRSGQLVEIVDGTYAGLPARVVGMDNEEQYKVVVCFRSDTRYLKLSSKQLKVLPSDIIPVEEEV
jgi:transcription antitermination factor NusG